jgi:CRP-like cAMP-binding protein
MATAIQPRCEERKISPGAEAFLRENLSREETENLKEYVSTVLVERGEILWEEREGGRYIALVVSGTIQTTKDTEFAGKSLIVGLHQPGAVIGVESVIDGFTMPETARAVTTAELLVLSRDDYERLLQESPAFAMKSLKGLLQIVSIRLKHSIERLSTFF